MARKKKAEDGKAGEGWLVTYSDLMTLLLTFFVLLISMAVFDERRKLVVLGSVQGTFGAGEANFNPMANREGKAQSIQPGAIEGKTGDLEALRDQMHEDRPGDLNFLENPFVQVFSMGADMLFLPGSHELSEPGRHLLRRILPTLMHVKNPVLIAGHISLDRDEGVTALTLDLTPKEDSWLLSLNRSLEVYRTLAEMGMPNGMLQVEGFGQYRPRYDNSTARGRRDNRRVDLVLDKRSELWIRELEIERRGAIVRERFSNRGNFHFDFVLPPASTPRR